MSTPLPDTGARTSFSTGAVRDAMVGKGFPHMIPPIAIRKIAKRFEDGAAKYGPMNFAKGIPLSRYQDAAIRHIMAWAEGQTDEDHLGAALWNLSCAAWTEEEIKAGRLPAHLDDLPYRPREGGIQALIDALKKAGGEEPARPMRTGDLPAYEEVYPGSQHEPMIIGPGPGRQWVDGQILDRTFPDRRDERLD